MDFVMTRHAVDRALDMALDPDEIRDAITRPRYEHYDHKTESDMFTRGRVTACIRYRAGVAHVTTFLWARASDWARDNDYGEYSRDVSEYANVRKVQKARRRKGSGRG